MYDNRGYDNTPTNQGEDNTDKDHDTGRDVLDQDNCGDEDTEEGDAHVPPELSLYHLVSLPAGVLGAHGEGSVGEVGLGHDLLDRVHGGDPLGRPAEQFVGQLYGGQLKTLNYQKEK